MFRGRIDALAWRSIVAPHWGQSMGVGCGLAGAKG